MPSRLRPLSLCVVVVLAGCGGLSTPLSESTDTSGASLPPGLSDDGVENAGRLAAAHDASLANASFTTRFAETIVAENGTSLVDRRGRQQVATNHSVWWGTTGYGVPQRLFDTSATTVDAWSNGTVTFYRATGGNETRYAAYLWTGSDWTGRELLRLFYRNATDVTVTTDDGSVHLSARLSGTLEAGQYPGVDITDGTLTAKLSERGRVERYSVDYTGTLLEAPETSVEGNYSREFSAVGETTVDPPAWVPTARNESTPAPIRGRSPTAASATRGH